MNLTKILFALFIIGILSTIIAYGSLIIYKITESNTHHLVELNDGTIEECRVASGWGGTSLYDCKSGNEYKQVTDLKILPK